MPPREVDALPWHDFDLLCKFIDQRNEEHERQRAEMRSVT